MLNQAVRLAVSALLTGGEALATEAAFAAADGGTSLLQVRSTVTTPDESVNPAIKELIEQYEFQEVRTEKDALTNIILVRAPMTSDKSRRLYEKYKDEIIFIGISSYEDWPLPAKNPYSHGFLQDRFVGMFPGFLNMYRNPEKMYPSYVKTIDLSQSDFALPNVDLSKPVPKKYDFIMSYTDQDVPYGCAGWAAFAKNFSFATEAMEVMCKDYGLTGVLIAAKKGDKACPLPEACRDKVEETPFLVPQEKFFDYMKQSRFLFLPQVHDASPRVSTQALAYDVPLLMNYNIIGGWKYLNSQTGEFFHDLSDFKQSLETLLSNIKEGDRYAPRKYALANLGDDIAGAKFKKFVVENFADRVKLPPGTTMLFPRGA